jgi:hypothetical protein
MADTTTQAPVAPAVSSKISAFKGIEVVLQILVAYGVSCLSVWTAKKFGLALDVATQTQLVMLGIALVTGILHGLYNFLTHKFPKIDLFKKFL